MTGLHCTVSIPFFSWLLVCCVLLQVAGSCGPSGPNCEYVYKLAAAIRDMGVTDPELFDLEARVRQLKGDVCMSA